MNKKVKNATRVSIDGIDFKSKMEAYFYTISKDNGINCHYEEDVFPLIDTFKPCKTLMFVHGAKCGSLIQINRSIIGSKYNPDFRVNLNNGIIVYIETKGMPTDSFIIKRKIFLKKLEDSNIKYIYIEPHSQKECREAIDLIKYFNVDDNIWIERFSKLANIEFKEKDDVLNFIKSIRKKDLKLENIKKIVDYLNLLQWIQ